MALSSLPITQLLVEWSKGNEAARNQLLPLVYDELRRIARGHMQKQSPGHILETTALIHEAYLRLAGDSAKEWVNRSHFFAVAATVMHHVLVDYARASLSAKRGGELRHEPLVEALTISADRLRELVVLDDALCVLEKLHPRQSQVVELRFFGGFSVEESAEILAVSPDTVMRDWRAARAFLYQEINGTQAAGD